MTYQKKLKQRLKKLLILNLGLLFSSMNISGMDTPPQASSSTISKAIASSSTATTSETEEASSSSKNQDEINHSLIIAINHQNIPAINSALKNGADINAPIPKKYAKNDVDSLIEDLEYKLKNNHHLTWQQSESLTDLFYDEEQEWDKLDGVEDILKELVFANHLESVSLLADPVKYLLPTECVLSANELTAQKAARVAALKFLPLHKTTLNAICSGLHVNFTSEGKTPLTQAIDSIDPWHEDTKIVSSLIKAGANVNQRIKKPNWLAHFSPLMLAIELGAVETILLLRSNKAKKDLLDTDILTAYKNKMRDWKDAVESFSENKSRLTAAIKMQKGFIEEASKVNTISEEETSEIESLIDSLMNDKDNSWANYCPLL